MAAISPDLVRTETAGNLRMIVARFSAGTADDGDTWASGLDPIVSYHTQDRDNPTTQDAVGVAVAESAGTFTFYPAEDNKAFDLFILVRAS